MNKHDKFNKHGGHDRQNSFDDFLTRQLRGAHPYLEDDGFAAKVLANLPVNQGLDRRVARLIIGIPMLLISLLVISQLPWQEVISLVWYWFMAGDLVVMIKLGIFASAAILVICLGWFARQVRLI